MSKRYTDEQIIGFLKQVAASVPVNRVCRKRSFRDAPFWIWRHNSGRMNVPGGKRMAEIEYRNPGL